jgi:hypothetical protein
MQLVSAAMVKVLGKAAMVTIPHIQPLGTSLQAISKRLFFMGIVTWYMSADLISTLYSR